MNNVVARGMGKADPVADNSTAAGRQLNRRVEMIVSGDVIGNGRGGGGGIRGKSSRIRSSAATLRNMRQGPTPSTVWTFFEQS
jgi:hypothetical protein